MQVISKGQIISKCFFGVFDFLQKTNENKSTWGAIVVKLNSFVRFLEEIEDTKNHFETIWPLIETKLYQFSKFLLIVSFLLLSEWIFFKNFQCVPASASLRVSLVTMSWCYIETIVFYLFTANSHLASVTVRWNIILAYTVDGYYTRAYILR